MPVEQLPAGAPWPDLPRACRFPQLNAHRRKWLNAICNGLNHKPLVLIHTPLDSGGADGILPLALVKSVLFGKFLVSLPYVNTGGVWTASTDAAQALAASACSLADEYGVRYLELRHEAPVEHPQFNARRTDKFHMRLALPGSDSELEASLKSKLRSQIKKSQEYGLAVQWGRLELVNDYYRVFSENMRDLGTPVFSRGLFRHILEEFQDEAELCVVRKDALPIAAGLLVHCGGVTEVPSASSLRRYNSTNANMWMYRQMLARAIARGSQVFDFGRSSEGSGTFKFKSQWGARPYPAVWQYYVRKGSAEDMRPESDGKQRLVRIWQKMPLCFTRLLGPMIVRGIP